MSTKVMSNTLIPIIHCKNEYSSNIFYVWNTRLGYEYRENDGLYNLEK